MLWLTFAGITLGVLAILVVPSLRKARQDEPTSRKDFDTAVYKDQLAEVDRDVERGVISETEAVTARLEIQRRLLTATGASAGSESTALASSAYAIPVLSIAAVAAAFFLYLDLGSPGEPDYPYALRADVAEAAAMAENAPDMEEAVARLEARMETTPDDPEGWMMLGRTYLTLERYTDAQRAFLKLYEVTGDIQAKAEYAEALVMGSDAQVTSEALDIFQEVLSADPFDPKARFYFGVAAAQQGNLNGALQIWTDLLHLSPTDAPWVPIVQQQIQRAADETGTDPSALKPTEMAAKLAEAANIQSSSMATPSLPGPSQEDVENAQQMTSDEQMEMIRSMVQRLADRLEADPSDHAGWLRLAQAYDVLGETEKAENARRHAAETAP